ncbi:MULTISPECIES: CvpA family protein [Vibrio]|jgi:membrane protein required for colicin V production|uniref:Bacteriocin production protein n=4 Tax=Vibrio TaxID=662 RepID=A0A2C9PCC2_9VIBR|nr:MULTISPECIES: CvpA family protein [Vibrio]ASI90348.1 bacteriocin production protein [Vibrio mediterranei]AYV22308.1 bacteriocin production protein [Vibrio mediterranei]EDL53784.1 bacteriocin production protein [Vibrio mediterranei AK1]KFA95919.1 bacteriocin production protein [Vibrio sp. ER1A]MCF4174694.1 CvpA family protein [Vibrio sp. McD22-P3]|eukprot:TRINITY_DN940_c0_g1_i1.p1 TRINITY_DN940_c0_g1~~TRINITY_DN940_c0_g1_i1.p1  ORF type:complete len:163 (-),score=4.44 TRINITY_DN940_c0_g1_i1:85-573(-)
MNWLDFVILGVIGLSALISLVRGFAKEAMSLVIWFGAFFIASQYYAKLAVYFTNIEDEMFRNGAAIAALFVATLIVGALINYVLGQLVQKTGLSGTDRVLGIVFGALRGVLIVSAVLFFVDTFTTLNSSEWWESSQLVPQFKLVIQPFFEHIEATSSFLSGA